MDGRPASRPRSRSRDADPLRRGGRPLGHGVRAVRPVSLEASLDQLVERDAAQRVELLDHDLLDAPGRLGRVGVSALAGLGDDRVDDAQLVLLAGRDLHGHGRLLALLGRSPQDGGAAFGADDRVDRVLERQHDVADGQPERAARAALAGDDDDDRGAQAGHQADRLGDRLGDAALLGRGAGEGPLDVDEGQDRHGEALGQVHDPHRLAVALGMGQAEVAADVLLGVLALLEADDDDAPAGDPARPATMAESSPKSRSPCSSMNSSAMTLSSSSVCGRLRLRACWTWAQTAAVTLSGLPSAAWPRPRSRSTTGRLPARPVGLAVA